jgi:hypothetical protein
MTTDTRNNAGSLPKSPRDWTGAVVNVTRAGLSVIGLGFSVLAIGATLHLLLLPKPLGVDDPRWFVPLAALVAAFGFFVVAKHFSISSVPFLIPDTLRWAHESGKYSAAEIESMIRTLEAHTGRAAFFTRIGFNGVALGTITSALLVLTIAVAANHYKWIEPKETAAILDLAKLLFGAFIGSFATRVPAPAEPQRQKLPDAAIPKPTAQAT